MDIYDFFFDRGPTAPATFDPARYYAGARRDAITQGLMSTGLGMLEAGGPQPRPVGVGQAISRGGLLGQNSYNQGIGSALRGTMAQAQLSQNQQQMKQQKAYDDYLAGLKSQAMQPSPGERPGPTPMAAGRDNQISQMLPMLEALGPQAGVSALMSQMNRAPIAAAPGTTLLDPRTYKPLYSSPEKPPEGFARTPEGGLSLIPGYAQGKGEIAAQTEPLMKVLNPDGTVKYTPRTKAVGQTAPDEAMIVMGPDGKPIFMKGGSAALQGMKSGLGTSAQSEVEKQLIDMTAQNVQVKRILAQAKPEFQQIGTRAGAGWAAIREKAGMNLDPADRQLLGDFTKYKAESGQYFADRLKAMSGGAVTPQEASRQETYLPNPGTGVFDGDAPTEFMAKAKRMEEFMTQATARLAYVSKRGMSIKDVPLDQMPKIIRERGDELAKQFQAQGIKDDAVRSAVRQRLAAEFGLVSE
jgi:hypothetical protein